MKFFFAANALVTITATTIVVLEMNHRVDNKLAAVVEQNRRFENEVNHRFENELNRRLDNERAELAATVVEQLRPILEQQHPTTPADGRRTASGSSAAAVSKVLESLRTEYPSVDTRRDERARHLLAHLLVGASDDIRKYLSGYVTHQEFDDFVSNTADHHITQADVSMSLAPLESRIAALELTVSDEATDGIELVGTGSCRDVQGYIYAACHWKQHDAISFSYCREAAISTPGALGFEYNEYYAKCAIVVDNGVTNCLSSEWLWESPFSHSGGTGYIDYAHTKSGSHEDDDDTWSCYRIADLEFGPSRDSYDF